MKRTERQRSAGVFGAARWWVAVERMISACWTGGRQVTQERGVRFAIKPE